MRSVHRRADGVVYVEFLMAFAPVFLLFLGATQLAFVAGAKLVVQHAASMAVRSAIVVLDDDPGHYDGEPRGQIARRGGRASNDAWAANATQRIGATSAAGTPGGGAALPASGGPRLQAIRLAAYAPLAILAPTPGTIVKWLGRTLSGPAHTNVRGAIGSSGFDRILFGFKVYNRAAAAVTFPVEPGSTKLHDGRVDPSLVTVRVTYLFHCAVPLVSRLVCKPVKDIAGFGRKRRGFWSRLTKRDESRERVREEMRRAEAPRFLKPLAITGARFAVLRAEATLPNQTAGYHRRKKQ